ncbi:ribosome assembly factor SBDS [Nanoarchaeota archaeon]
MEKQFLSDTKAQTLARIKIKGNTFEIIVDTIKAFDYQKKKEGNLAAILVYDNVFRDYKKGIRAGKDELEIAFGTSDLYEITKKMILEGEVLMPLEIKTKAREEKVKQIVEWLAKSCVNPQTGLPHPPQRIKSVMDEVGAKIDTEKSTESQAFQVMKLIQKILPIKIEVKRIAVKIQPAHTGKVYGILKEFLIKEEWLADGSLSCVLDVPRASLMSFYDKLNSVTHGTALTKEM